MVTILRIIDPYNSYKGFLTVSCHPIVKSTPLTKKEKEKKVSIQGYLGRSG